jgi:hypothetical protein
MKNAGIFVALPVVPPLGAALNVLLLSLGLASITFLLLVGHQLTKARSSATWPALTWLWVPRAAPCS